MVVMFNKITLERSGYQAYLDREASREAMILVDVIAHMILWEARIVLPDEDRVEISGEIVFKSFDAVRNGSVIMTSISHDTVERWTRNGAITSPWNTPYKIYLDRKRLDNDGWSGKVCIKADRQETKRDMFKYCVPLSFSQDDLRSISRAR